MRPAKRKLQQYTKIFQRRAGKPATNPEILFWSHVDKSGDCWVWTAHLTANGYGQLGICGVTTAAHRYSYKLANGPIPPGLFVCHHCDNPPCVNPAHLFLGTHADNMRDMADKGRSRTPRLLGEDSPASKLTELAVKSIRERVAGGESMRSVARSLSITAAQVSNIVNRLQWKSVA